jgi:hypothetical protein
LNPQQGRVVTLTLEHPEKDLLVGELALGWKFERYLDNWPRALLFDGIAIIVGGIVFARFSQDVGMSFYG